DLGRYGPEDQARLQAALADAYAAHGHLPRAEELLAALAQQEPDNLRLCLARLDLARRQTGREEPARELEEQVRRLEKDKDVLWCYTAAPQALAQVQAGEKQRIPEIRARLTEVVARRRNWSRGPLLQGDLYWLEGDQARALDCYLKA